MRRYSCITIMALAGIAMVISTPQATADPTGAAVLAEFLEFPADPGAGFNFPYLLHFAGSAKAPVRILVVPNNTGKPSEDIGLHRTRALAVAGQNRGLADALGCALLVPIFPRPADMYVHALDRATILRGAGALARVDLQLLAMVADARGKLAGLGVTARDKILLGGYSAAGAFAAGFCAIHPAAVEAAAIGAPGFGPFIPLAEWKGRPLPYPTGAADFRGLFGADFDLAAYRGVRLFIYGGDVDDNLIPDDSMPRDESNPFGNTFGTILTEAQKAYDAAGVDATFKLYPGADHLKAYADSRRDVEEFFRKIVAGDAS